MNIFKPEFPDYHVEDLIKKKKEKFSNTLTEDNQEKDENDLDDDNDGQIQKFKRNRIDDKDEFGIEGIEKIRDKKNIQTNETKKNAQKKSTYLYESSDEEDYTVKKMKEKMIQYNSSLLGSSSKKPNINDDVKLKNTPEFSEMLEEPQIKSIPKSVNSLSTENVVDNSSPFSSSLHSSPLSTKYNRWSLLLPPCLYAIRGPNCSFQLKLLSYINDFRSVWGEEENIRFNMNDSDNEKNSKKSLLSVFSSIPIVFSSRMSSYSLFPHFSTFYVPHSLNPLLSTALPLTPFLLQPFLQIHSLLSKFFF
jgi:hypothetical protein